MRFELGDRVVLISGKCSVARFDYKTEVFTEVVVTQYHDEKVGRCYVIKKHEDDKGGEYVFGGDMISLQMYNSPLYRALD